MNEFAKWSQVQTGEREREREIRRRFREEAEANPREELKVVINFWED